MKRVLCLMAVLCPVGQRSAIGNQLSAWCRKYKRKQPDNHKRYNNSLTDKIGGKPLGTAFHVCRTLRSAPHPLRGLAMVFATFGMLWLSPARAQTDETNTIKPLQIGDTIPEYLWHMPLQVVNHPEGKDTITLNDYRDKKLVIVDFWATWCAPCITSLRKLDTLQHQLANELTVIPTTYEDANKAGIFMVKEDISIPTVVSDTLLKQCFPHRGVPHQIWIKDNKIRAIVGSQDGTIENIVRVMEDDDFILHTKNDILDYSRETPIAVYAHRVNSPILFSSIITGCIDGIATRLGRIQSGNTHIEHYTNVTITSMYRRVLSVNHNRIVIQSDSVEKYIYTGGNKAQLFTYQLMLPKVTPSNVRKERIINDLNSFFHFKLDSQVMEVECYVIVDSSTTAKKGTVVSGQDEKLSNATGRDLSTLVRLLNLSMTWAPNRPIYINESNYKGKVPVDHYDKIQNDPEMVKTYLLPYGLTIRKERRPIQMYILSEQTAEPLSSN